MSLVDYASSSDDDVSEAQKQEEKEEQSRNPNEQSQQIPKQQPPPPLKSGASPSNQRRETAPTPSLPTPSFEKLPDASVLLNSASMPVVAGTDHASRVAAAMAESAARKRDSNGVASTLRRSKIPKESLPNSKDVQDTADDYKHSGGHSLCLRLFLVSTGFCFFAIWILQGTWFLQPREHDDMSSWTSSLQACALACGRLIALLWTRGTSRAAGLRVRKIVRLKQWLG